MYISQKDLEDFEKKYVEENDTRPLSYCKSAEEMVENFLGYSPEEKEYTSTIKGDGGYLLPLEAFPVSSITSFIVDGVEHNVEEIEVTSKKRNYVEFVDGSRFLRGQRYKLTYKAGYPNVSTVHFVYSEDGITFYSDVQMQHAIELPEGITPEATEVAHQFKYTTTVSTVPEIIKITALQIASLFWESAGGNLAVSSTSFADTGSRVFNNFKADRFLEQLENYRRRF